MIQKDLNEMLTKSKNKRKALEENIETAKYRFGKNLLDFNTQKGDILFQHRQEHEAHQVLLNNQTSVFTIDLASPEYLQAREFYKKVAMHYLKQVRENQDVDKLNRFSSLRTGLKKRRRRATVEA